jgi:hypothetical protein
MFQGGCWRKALCVMSEAIVGATRTPKRDGIPIFEIAANRNRGVD